MKKIFATIIAVSLLASCVSSYKPLPEDNNKTTTTEASK